MDQQSVSGWKFDTSVCFMLDFVFILYSVAYDGRSKMAIRMLQRLVAEFTTILSCHHIITGG